MKTVRTIACAFCAGLVTPILIVASTANARYLANQNELGRDRGILLPYLAVTLVAALVGAALYLAQGDIPAGGQGKARGGRVPRTALWAFYLAGPLYFGYRATRRAYRAASGSVLAGTAEVVAVAALCLLFAAALLWLTRRPRDPRSVGPLLCAIGLLFSANEAYQFASRVEPTDQGRGILDRIGRAEKTAGIGGGEQRATLPNIYHVILDGFQTDMFDHVFEEEELGRELPGFVHFRENTTVYGRTAFSVPSTFYGEAFDGRSSQTEYVCGPFDSERSFLAALKSLGYVTYAFPTLGRQGNVRERLLDVCLRLPDAIVVPRPQAAATFAKFWLATCFPGFVSSPFVRGEEREALKRGRFTPGDSVVKARLAFEEFLRIERGLGGRGRYTFLHLMIPHPPFVLGSDCSASGPEGALRTHDEAHLDQILCAKKVILELLRALKDLERYRSSMVIIQGDHGFYATVRDGRLVDLGNEMVRETGRDPENLSAHVGEVARTRSRALLLLKLPDAESPFTVSSAETTLVDLAPTVHEAVGAPPRRAHEGVSLVHPERVPKDRERTYHFHDFVTVGGVRMLAERMGRWRIRGDSMVSDGVIDLEMTLGK